MKVLYIIITFILLILGVISYIFDITKSKQKIFAGKPGKPKHSPTPTPHSTHTRASHFFNEKVKKIISICLAVLCLSHLIISIVQFSNAGVDGVKNGLNPFGKSPPWFLSFIIITLLSVITIWNAINMFISSDQITAVL